MNIQFYLPFPPSINKYWVRTRVGMKRSKHAVLYQAEALSDLNDQIGHIEPIGGKIMVSLVLFPPDKRRRDLDNFNKPVLDSLVHFGLIVDDSQIDQLFIYRGSSANSNTNENKNRSQQAARSSGSVFVKIVGSAPILKQTDLMLI